LQAEGDFLIESTKIKWFSAQSDGRQWQPKALKTKLAQERPSGSSPLRS
jgi:hypothetical protein